MYLRIFFLVLVILLSSSLINTESLDTRIIGGVVSPNPIPYQIALYINGYFSCGGSLITENCVLTAAHCVKGKAASAFKVRAGITKLSSSGGVSRTVSQTFVPSEYNANTLNHDVAILKLSTALTGTNIGTIALNSEVTKVGDPLKVSGWGVTKESGSVSDQLRYVVVPAIAKATCNTAYSGSLTNTMFCAAAKGKDSCSGDSGGPVVKDNRQYGIVSWGYGCAREKYAGVYTSVKQVLPWVNSIKAKYC